MNQISNLPTGRTEGQWTEYEETLYLHSKGCYWLRSDGLRFGLRLAGDYYRPGTTPELVESPYHPRDYPSWHPKSQVSTPNGSFHDGAMAFDIVGSLREKAKREYLPTHLRVMRDGIEIELISKIDSIPIETLITKEDFCPFAFLDLRYPMNRTTDAKTPPTTTKKARPQKKKSKPCQ